MDEQFTFLRDVDLIIEADQAAAAAVADGTMFNVIHLSSLLKADFILRRDEPFERAKFARRRTVDLDGTPVAVISPEDLILSNWAAALHLTDALQALRPE